MQLYCGFSLWHQMAPQQSAKFIAVFFGQFRTSLRNDSVVNYESNWTLFSKSVMQRSKHFVDISRLTLDPAGMHCPTWDDAFVSS